MIDLNNCVAKIMEVYKTSVFEKNVGAFMDLYDRHVRIFDTWGVWSYEGAHAWRITVEAWFSSLGTERVRVTFEDVQASADTSLAGVSAFVTYASLSAEGLQLRSMQNRITWVLRAVGSDSEWKIAHEHTSAPVGFKDGKAILSR
jgi:ketosteroid isomerase-like protein